MKQPSAINFDAVIILENKKPSKLEWSGPAEGWVLCGSDALYKAGLASVNCRFGTTYLFPIFSRSPSVLLQVR